MKETKILAVLTILFILLTMLSINSYAAEGDTFELQVNASASTLNPGDDFTVNLVLDKINVTSGDQGIGAYQAKLIYDANVLELVSVTSASGWEVSQNEGNIIANTSNGQVVKQRTNTAVISFKLKNDTSVGHTTISLENVTGSSGVTINGIGIKSIISIEQENNSDENQTGNTNTSGENNTVGEDTSTGANNTNSTPTRNNTSIGSNINSSTTANKVLPKAGLTNFVVILIAILIIASIVFLVKYKILKLK